MGLRAFVVGFRGDLGFRGSSSFRGEGFEFGLSNRFYESEAQAAPLKRTDFANRVDFTRLRVRAAPFKEGVGLGAELRWRTLNPKPSAIFFQTNETPERQAKAPGVQILVRSHPCGAPATTVGRV